MDVKNLIHLDEHRSTAHTPGNLPPFQSQSRQSPLDNGVQSSHSTPSVYDTAAQSRPAPPPPLQPPSSADYRSSVGSSSYVSAQSPYRDTPPSATSAGQYPFPQSRSAQSPGLAQQSRTQAHPSSIPPGPHSTVVGPNSYGQQSPSPYTPTGSTPGGYPFQYHQQQQQQQQPQLPQQPAQQQYIQSAHSTPTPQSANSHYSYAQRESPLSARSQSHPSQHQQLSQPGTPLGPPTSSARAPSRGHEPPSPYSHNRTHSASSFTGAQLSYTSPPMTSHGASQIDSRGPSLAPSHSPPNSSSSSHKDNYFQRDRERTLSVSPKTKTALQIPQSPAPTAKDDWVNHIAPVGRKHEGTRASNFPVDSSSAPSMPYQPHDASLGPQTRGAKASEFHVEEMHNGTHRVPNNPDSAMMSGEASSLQIKEAPLSPPIRQSTEFASTLKPQPSPMTEPTRVKRQHSLGPSSPNSTSASQHTRKRLKRDEEVPVFARRAANARSKAPFAKRTRPPFIPYQENGRFLLENFGEGKIKLGNMRNKHASDGTNGLKPHHSTEPNDRISDPQMAPDSQNLSEAWEPSFSNIIPSEELTKSVCEFVYSQVLTKEDGDGGLSGVSGGGNAVFEVEAKIGRIVDRNTNERLRLPVLTECILSNADPSLQVAFKSSMTVLQHRNFNDTLNLALQKSMLGSRKKMTYKHVREKDSFYELSQAAHLMLPASIRNTLNPRRNIRLRVTRDQKDGKILAKIIKVRIADLNVYSPRTIFDWRISVNVEMDYEGDISDCVPVTEGGRGTDRNKDRVSYTHQAYQIDLTQVTPPDSTSISDKEHELEVEISSEALRREGSLLKAGKPSQYEDLIRGFIDNVRLLARAIRE